MVDAACNYKELTAPTCPSISPLYLTQRGRSMGLTDTTTVESTSLTSVSSYLLRIAPCPVPLTFQNATYVASVMVLKSLRRNCRLQRAVLLICIQAKSAGRTMAQLIFGRTQETVMNTIHLVHIQVTTVLQFPALTHRVLFSPMLALEHKGF